MEKNCIICEKPITHHHKYCDDCYPQKTATIKDLSNKFTKLQRVILSLLNPCVNPNKYITKKQLIVELNKKGIKYSKNLLLYNRR